MNRQPCKTLSRTFYQNLLVVSTLIFLTSCGSGGSNSNDNTGINITLNQETVVEGSNLEFVISVSNTNTLQSNKSNISVTLTFTGSAAEDFTTTTLTVTNGEGEITTATLVPIPVISNDTSKQFTVTAENISITNITTITLVVPDDDRVETTETLTVTVNNINIDGVDLIGITDSVNVDITDNDVYELSITNKKKGNEEGRIKAEFIISVSPTNESGAAITGKIEWDWESSSADLSDFSTSTLFLPDFSIADGTNKTTITLPSVKDDAAAEGTEKVIAQISNINTGDYNNRIGTARASIDIVDNDAYTLDIVANPNNIQEGSDVELAITVSPPNESGLAITGTLTWEGSADEGDFNNSFPSNFSIADGQTTDTIILTVKDDLLVESTETLKATVNEFNTNDYENILGAKLILGISSVTVNISDNDIYTLSITPKQGSVTEGENVEFIVGVSPINESGSAITGSIIVTGTATTDDFTNLTNDSFPTEFSIADGEKMTTIALSVTEDNDIEKKVKILEATISSINSGKYRNSISTDSASVNIQDDDFYTLNITTTKQDIVEGEDTNIEFIVSISPTNESGSTITVFITVTGTATTDDFDLNDPFPTEFLIANGKNETTFSLTVKDDEQIESTETLTVIINGINDYLFILSPASATVNIEDNDAYELSIKPNQDGSENGIGAEFIVSISPANQSNDPIIGIIAINGESEENSGSAKGIANEVDFSDFTTTFPIAGLENTATIRLTVADDEWVESTETLTVTLKGLENYKSELSTDTASVNIEDNDIYTLNTTKTQDGIENVRDAQFTIDVSSLNISGEDITGILTFTGSAAGDFISTTTFSIVNGENSTIVTLLVPDDNEVEKTKELIATISDISSGKYRNNIGTASATANIEDDDIYTLNITKQDGSEEGTNAQFTITVSPSNASGSTITGSIIVTGTATTNDFTNLTNDSFPTEFSIANGENKKVIILQVKDDDLIEDIEDNERLTFNISNINSSGYKNTIVEGSAIADIVDNDRPYIDFSSSNSKILDISWNSASNATSYIVSENKDSNSGFDEIGTVVNPNTNYSTAVSLIGPNRVTTNTQYMVEAKVVDYNNPVSVAPKNLTQTDITKLIGDITSSNTVSFGWKVALSGNGKTLVVSDVDTFNSSTGSVYIYTLDENDIWNQTGGPIQGNNNDQFGFSIALNNEGTILAVGAPQDSSNGQQNDNSLPFSGAVYLFTLGGSSWTQTAYIKANNMGQENYFGWAVSLNDDATVLAVSSPYEDSDAISIDRDDDNAGANNSGAVYLFTLGGSSWTQTTYIKASNAEQGDAFGISVALSSDGRTLAVGANQENSNATGTYSIQHPESNNAQNNNAANDSGAVYLFTLDSSWTQTAYIKASNTGEEDYFGRSIALSDNGRTLAVAAFQEGSNAIGVDGDDDNDGADNSGAVYLFTLDSSWKQTAYIKASNAEGGDNFGISVALNSDGTTLVVGAWLESSNATGIDGDEKNNVANDSGAAYLFMLNSEGKWNQTNYIKAKAINSLGDQFGSSVDLNSDGTSLAIGASKNNGGVVFLY